ncbi:MAG: hypothetical protein V9G10_08765 [Candidatus Nanopelagicales bacterium]
MTTSDGQSNDYEHVLVANGHHSSPKIPHFDGEYTGESFHAHDYRDPVGLHGQAGLGDRRRQLRYGHRLRRLPHRRVACSCPPGTACT